MSPTNWINEIVQRQKNKTINNNIDAKYMVLLITGIVDSIIFPGGQKLTVAEEKEYLSQCIEGLVKILE